MRLKLSRPVALPWVVATAAQWKSALRSTLAMCLALTFAYALQLDQPWWALTSAAVVSGMSSVGGIISKSLGRLAGSLLGACAALLIAGNTLNEPWLFTFYIAGWLAICTWAASHQQNNVAYAFALAGYTAAIIVFTLVELTDTAAIWNTAQARFCEVITGILCGGVMMIILPGSNDGEALIGSLRAQHQRLLEHASWMLNSAPSGETRHAHQAMIGQVLTLNLLRIQAFWSHYRFRRYNPVVNYLLHQQLRMTSVSAGLRRMLLNWPAPPARVCRDTARILSELARPESDKYRLARLLQPLLAAGATDFRYRTWGLQLRSFCWLSLNVRRWLRQLEQADSETRLSPPRTPPLSRRADSTEAAWNALRTFVAVVTGCGFWIATQWENGAAALTLLAITCVLYASTPSPTRTLSLLMKTLVALSAFSFVLVFGVMIQVNDMGQFLLLFFPLVLTLYLLKAQHPRHAPMLGQFIVFMGSFIAVTNPPVFDYPEFINDNLGRVLGVMLSIVAFYLLSPSSDRRRSRRHIQTLRRDFLDQLRPMPTLSEQQFESRVYYLINPPAGSVDHPAHLALLRWGVVLLNCSHLLWQLRDGSCAEPALLAQRHACVAALRRVFTPRDISAAALEGVLQDLHWQIAQLASRPEPAAGELAGMLWRLYAALTPLRGADSGAADQGTS
ncbi:FUSC family protein [Pantoea sp. 1.19]|uniref:FUSC family protein n=1 Tax=Pantoea sp. 1.19 TaxID=1925589 RepID=UPI000948C7EB|nr:FUSC family protein [Pantoea sp. 1.19]